MNRSQRRTKVSVECKVGTYLLNEETVHNIFNIYMNVEILGPNSWYELFTWPMSTSVLSQIRSIF